jgi:PAS domain S-box-containing protein
MLLDLSRSAVTAKVNEIPFLLRQVLEAAGTMTGTESGSVYLLDHRANELNLAAQRGTTAAGAWPERLAIGGHPLPAASVRESQQLAADVGTRLSHAVISIPLLAGGRCLGFLYLSGHPRSLDPSTDSLELVATLASYAAIAVERRNRERDTERLKEWLSAFSSVLDASRSLRSPADIRQLLARIVESAKDIAAADLVILYEYFEERRDVRMPPVHRGDSFSSEVLTHKGVVIDHHNSLIFRMLHRGENFYASKAPHDWIAKGLIDSAAAGNPRSFFNRERIVSSAGLPLKIDAERVGLLFLNYRRPFTFHTEFKEHFDLFAQQAALALGNARFFLRSQQYGRKLRILNSIGQRLGSANLSTGRIGRILENQVHRLMKQRNFFFCLCDDAGRLSLAYMRDQHDTADSVREGLQAGLAAYVCGTREPLLARSDALKRIFAEGKARLVGALPAVWMGVPMKVRGKVIGILVVQDYEDETSLTPEDQYLLSTIAAHAATAIDNHRQLNEERQENKELSALLELSKAFGTTKPLTPLLSSILNHLCKLADCDGSFLFLRDKGHSQHLKVFATSNGFEEMVGELLNLGEGIAGEVVRLCKPAVQYDYGTWERRAPFADRARLGPPYRVCGAPLVWENQVIGAITLSSSAKGIFSDREIKLLQRFAGPITIAIQHEQASSFRKALIESGPNAIVAIDRGGRITEFSEAAGRIFGYHREELIGRSIIDLYWDGQSEAKRITRQLRTKGWLKDETLGRGRDGEKIPIALSAVTIRSSDGEMLGSAGALEDLRLALIVALRGKLRQLVDAIGTINAADRRELLFELIVLHSVELLGADAACVFSKEGDSFVVAYCTEEGPVEVETEAMQQYLSALATQETALPRTLSIGNTAELRLSPHSRSAVAAPIRIESRVLGLLLLESQKALHFLSDLELLNVLALQGAVAINRIQLRLEREEQLGGLLVSTNAIKVGQIATSFIHEVGNALSAMSITVENLRDELNSEPELKRKDNYCSRLSGVQSEVQRIDDLARRLQDVTKQGLRAEKRSVHFNEIVSTTLQLLASEFKNKRLRVDLRLDSSLDKPDLPGGGNPIAVDDRQIQQVLINLIVNAIAASEERGRLVIETSNNVRRNHVELRLIDHGRGMSAEERRQIFDPHYTTKQRGVGLGLFISRILIEENHGGAIEVSSSVGRGSTFTVLLPRLHA